MAKTPKNIGHGEGGSRTPDLEALLNDIADDLAAQRAAIVGLTAKLDADAGVTDIDYAATLDPAARKHLASDE